MELFPFIVAKLIFIGKVIFWSIVGFVALIIKVPYETAKTWLIDRRDEVIGGVSGAGLGVHHAVTSAPVQEISWQLNESMALFNILFGIVAGILVGRLISWFEVQYKLVFGKKHK